MTQEEDKLSLDLALELDEENQQLYTDLMNKGVYVTIIDNLRNNDLVEMANDLSDGGEIERPYGKYDAKANAKAGTDKSPQR
jgi:hypothetical protein